MDFLVTVPDTKHHLWQALVQINNFQKYDYDINLHYLVISYNFRPSDILRRMMESKRLRCHFHLFPDLRINKNYIVSSKPYLVKQFFFQNPQYQNRPWFYTDPDLYFTKPMDFEPFIHDDTWYLSDTRSYLNSKYIKSKGEGLFEELCALYEVDPALIEANDENAGGAQWIIKHSDFALWDHIEFYSQKMFDLMVATAPKYTPKKMVDDPANPGKKKEVNDYPIQSWTAEMWAMLWIPWKLGIQTRIDKRLQFSWANWQRSDCDKYALYHNAGLPTPKPDGKNFCKIAYQDSPFGKEIPVSEKSIGSRFVEEIRDTEKNFPELIW